MSERAHEMRHKAEALLTRRAEVVYFDGRQLFGTLEQGQAGIAIMPDAENQPLELHDAVLLDYEAIEAIIPAEATGA
jgi:hypothetical protein